MRYVVASQAVNAVRLTSINDGPVPLAVARAVVKVLAVAFEAEMSAVSGNQEVQVEGPHWRLTLELS
jgi:hypothetical protein